MGFSDVSVFMKVSMALGIVALLFDLIGFASPFWFASSGYSGFLWQYCGILKDGGSKTCEYFPESILTPAIKAGQAFNVLGFLAGDAAVVLIILYIFFLTAKKPVRLIGMIAAIVAAGFILIGVILIGTSQIGKVAPDGWAMILAIIGALLYIATVVVMVVDLVQNK